MTTAEVQSLLDENTCLSCYGLSLSDLIKIGLLSNISSSGGGGGGTPSLPLNSVQFNDGGVFGGDADLTWNKTTNLLAITGGIALTAEANETPFSVTGYSLTGANAQSMLSLAGTWNTSGTPTAIDLDITDTASSATSFLLNLRVGGTTRFSVNKAGDVIANRVSSSNSFVVLFDSSVLAPSLLRLATDCHLTRDAADVFAERNSTTAQTHRFYRTFTDLSNYERIAIQSAAGKFIIAAETAGTGTDDLDMQLTPAGAGLIDITTTPSVDVAVASTHSVRVKFGGTEYKVLLATP